MTLRKMIYINTICIFGLCFLTHFLYTMLPNPIFAIFFPVNESIWEHMKMLFSTTLIYGVVQYIVLEKYKIKHHNFLLTIFICSFVSVPIYLALFLPIYNWIGEQMIITFILLFLVIGICQYIGYRILKLPAIKHQSIIGITGIILFCIFMGYLTYKPPRSHLFFDTKDEKYGIHYFIVP